MKRNIKWEVVIGTICCAWVDIFVVASIVHMIMHPEVGLWRVPLLSACFVPWNVTMYKSLLGEWSK